MLVEEIVERTVRGESRDDIARQAQIKVASLDQRMRRAGYRWDDLTFRYVSCELPIGEHIIDGRILPAKIVNVVTMFNKITADAKEVATRNYYRNEQEMAEDMKRNGFIWSSERHNYVPINLLGDEMLEPTSIDRDHNTHREEVVHNDPFKQESEKSIVQIPRYRNRSRRSPKTLGIATNLQQFLSHVSAETSIGQGEITEVALIEFFLKYGYEKEITTLLQ